MRLAIRPLDVLDAARDISAQRLLQLLPRLIALASVVFALVWVLFAASSTNFGPAIDDPTNFFVTLLNGLTFAGLLFIVASGFALIFGLMRVINMAQGAFFLLGGYIAYDTQQAVAHGGGQFLLPAQVNAGEWIIPALVATISIGILGLAVQQLFLRWNQGQDLRQALITIAISVILADQMLAHFGGVAEDIAWPRNFDTFTNVHVAGIPYTTTRLVILGIAVGIGWLLCLWLA